jgi:alpha-beta hydrolase superfamily lysophospholipase
MMRAVFDRLSALLALALVLASLWGLQSMRQGIVITQQTVGQTPVIRYAFEDASGPVIVVAHGFAGSAQMMQAYALTLAQAGFRVFIFDFEGHGRNPVPMSGDVTAIDGTTRLLMDQTLEVVGAVAEPDRPTGVLGHSMATDVLVRAALTDDVDIGPLVLLSAFSGAVTADAPRDMVMIAGQWEQRLRDFGLEAVQMIDADAREGDLVRDGDVVRKAVSLPYIEHVSILHSRAGQQEALDWFNGAFDQDGEVEIAASGWWLLGLLAGIVVLARPLARLLPQRETDVAILPAREVWLMALVPAVSVPVIATYLDVQVLPVLVADYLALHLFIFGVFQLGALWRLNLLRLRVSASGVAALLFWGLAVFGLALDRYGANFVPIPARWWIIAALSLGTLPFMLADALATQGGMAPLWQRMVLRVGFFASLIWAVVLDFEGLFFLMLIAPVMVLFYVVYGFMGRWVALRVGPATSGVALGLILAYALGVSFPLFAAGG